MVTESNHEKLQGDSEQKPIDDSTRGQPKETKYDISCLNKEVYVMTEKGLQRITPADIIADLMSRMKW